jgi:glycosyltransferase involved in cell wall biosynthesis
MRILCVIDNLGSGGAQRQLVNLACGLKSRGHTVEVFTYYSDDHFRPELDFRSVPVHLVQKKSRFSLKPLFALRSMVRQWNFDAVIAFLETPCVYAELAAAGILRKVRVIASERSMVYGGMVSPDRYAKSQIHRLAHNVVANSFFHGEWITSNFPFLRAKVAVIWNGIDLEQFHPPQAAPMQGRMLRLLGVGRIQEAKNLVCLARAVGKTICSGISLVVDWAGRVDDAVYYEKVQQAVAIAGVSHRWHWLGERKDVPELMRKYDALILPSIYEGLPNVICEALASGLPVLASRVSDNSRLVQNNVNGFTFDPCQEDEITQAIRSFVALSHDAQQDFRKAARQFAETNLSMDKFLSSYEAILTHDPQ